MIETGKNIEETNSRKVVLIYAYFIPV
jgi:hypothetical protein